MDEAPPAQFLRVSIEQSYACALRPDGRAVQWSLGGVSAEPGDRVFIEVANSYGVCCGLSEAGRVYCSEASYPQPQEE